MMQNYRTFCPVCLKYVHMGDLVTCGKAAECGLKTDPPIEEIPLDFDRNGLSAAQQFAPILEDTQQEKPTVPQALRDALTLHKELQKTATDRQVGGDHYASQAIQPIHYIFENNLGFCEGNVIKYVTRYQKKNGVEDLKKARHYLDMLIERLEAK